MSTDTKIKTLIFNKLTQEKYNNTDRVPTEFYLTPDTSIDSSEKGAANGVASLDTNGKVPTEQIPVATTSALGGVKPDGTTITVTEDGTISATGGSGSSATGLSIGDVVYSYSSLSSENPGKLPLFTGETIASANTIYPEFYNWVLSHTGLQCTSAEYEASLTTYGECAKYVIGSGSLRLPLIKNYIKAANPSEGIKNIEAGLPDHNHTVSGSSNWGSLSQTGNSVALVTQVTTSNASASNPIYGKSSTVTPASTTLYPWVVAYTSAIPASTAQAAEFQQGLSGKADVDLSNITSLGKKSSVSWIMPDYSRDVATGLAGSPTSATTNSYTCPTDGWILMQASRAVTGFTLHFRVNGIVRLQFQAFSACYGNLMYPVRKGDVISLTTDETSATWLVSWCDFMPCKGA